MTLEMITGYAPLTRDLEAIAGRLRLSTVQVQGRRPGAGSGVIWRSTGLVITNAHVVRGLSATVKLSDGRVFGATIAFRDPQRDLAALQVEASDLPAAPIGDSSALHVGELVFAVGNPLGSVGALTAGIVHALSPADGAYGREYIQADLHLAPGNSGGLLADAQGRVIGINSMVAGGVAFAVPSNTVGCFLESGGMRPRLGVTLRSVSVPLTGEHIFGLLVLEVTAGSSAEAAGILIGDVLIGVDGQRFGSPKDLSRALQHARAGDRFSIDLTRGGQPIVSNVEVRGSMNATEAA
jgi:serine protease Do